MRYLRPVAVAVAVVVAVAVASLVALAPAVQAAPALVTQGAPVSTAGVVPGSAAGVVPAPARDACGRALAAAGRAEREYDLMRHRLLRIIAGGGHPDTAQRQALAVAEAERDMWAAHARRLCGT
ncbi:hypothetical protein [Streptomyces collinus]|uniref:hypothetical protein n=1 Tax=Streptomyces collinus TaxID=42684 RepID=UPI00381521ED